MPEAGYEWYCLTAADIAAGSYGSTATSLVGDRVIRKIPPPLRDFNNEGSSVNLCPVCGMAVGHDVDCREASWNKAKQAPPADPEDDPYARGKAEDAYLNNLIGEG